MINRTLSMLSADRIGHFKAVDGTTWEAGQVASIGTTGITTATTATVPIGLFVNNNTNTLTNTVYDEVAGPVDYSAISGTATVTLAHPNITASSYEVFADTTQLTENTDFTLNTTNAVLTAVVSGALDSVNGTYLNEGMITVRYRYTMSTAELNGFLSAGGDTIGGAGYLNNYIEINDTLETTVAGEGSLVYTSMYVPTDTFTVGNLVYSNASGYLTTTDAGSQRAVGIVYEAPSSTRAFLGVKITLS